MRNSLTGKEVIKKKIGVKIHFFLLADFKAN